MDNIHLEVDSLSNKVVVSIKDRKDSQRRRAVAKINGTDPAALQLGWITGLRFLDLPEEFDRSDVNKYTYAYFNLLPFDDICHGSGSNFIKTQVLIKSTVLRVPRSLPPPPVEGTTAYRSFVSSHLSENEWLADLVRDYSITLSDPVKCIRGLEIMPTDLHHQFGTARHLFDAALSCYIDYDFESLPSFDNRFRSHYPTWDKSAGFFYCPTPDYHMGTGSKAEGWSYEYENLLYLRSYALNQLKKYPKFVTKIQFKMDVSKKEKARIFFMVPLVQYMLSSHCWKNLKRLIENTSENFIGWQWAYGGNRRWKDYWDFDDYNSYWWIEADIKNKDNHCPWDVMCLFFELMGMLSPNAADPFFDYFSKVDADNTAAKILHWFGNSYRFVVGGLPSGHFLTGFLNTEHVRWILRLKVFEKTGSYESNYYKFAVQGDNLCVKVHKTFYDSKEAATDDLVRHFSNFHQTLRDVYIFDSPYTEIGAETGWSFLKRRLTKDLKIHRAREELYAKSVLSAKKLNLQTYSHKLIGLVWQCPYDVEMYDYFYELWKKVQDSPVDPATLTASECNETDMWKNVSMEEFMRRAEYKGIPTTMIDLGNFPSQYLIARCWEEECEAPEKIRLRLKHEKREFDSWID